MFYTIMYTKSIYNSLGATMALANKNEPISINIRAKSQQRDLIDLAAKQQGRSRSDFMLQAACREAETVLLDQAFFTVDAATFDELNALIDKPLEPTEKLKKLLNTKAPWDNK